MLALIGVGAAVRRVGAGRPAAARCGNTDLARQRAVHASFCCPFEIAAVILTRRDRRRDHADAAPSAPARSVRTPAQPGLPSRASDRVRIVKMASREEGGTTP